MKKIKIFLLLTIILNIINMSFAFPMTLTQQTVGEFADINKEFIYYIKTDNVRSIEDAPNVEIISKVDKYCGCGTVFSGLDPDFKTKWLAHNFTCTYGYIDSSYTVYKITLKNGEEVKLDAIGVDTTPRQIYTIREDNYLLSTIFDDKTTTISQNEKLVNFAYYPKENRTVILNRAYYMPVITGINTTTCVTLMPILIYIVILTIYKCKKIIKSKDSTF